MARDPAAEIFVFRIGNLGDTLVALPAIHRISQLHGHAPLTLITNTPVREGMVTAWDVLKHTGLFRQVIFYERNSPWKLCALARRCRRSREPILYYLAPARTRQQVRRDEIFFRGVCGIHRIQGLTPSRVDGLRDASGQQLITLPKECDRLLALVDPEGSRTGGPDRLLSPPEAAQQRARALLAPLGNRPIIAFGPGSKMPAKKWFLDRYVGLVQRLVAERPDIGIAVFGGAEDREDGETLVEAAGAMRALNLAGGADIIESAACFELCDLYVGNDTGTMHLAAIMGVPCTAIFTSRANRDVWHPWGDSHTILRHDLPCSGCNLERCVQHRMRCLDLIEVDDVWAALAPRLAALGPTRQPARKPLPVV